MESFTHESEDSSSCTQSDADSTNSSNGTNPFLLCPRANSSLHLQLGGQGRAHDTTEDTRPFKLARMEPSRHRQYHASAVAKPLGASSLQYPHNMVGAIHGADGLHGSALLSQDRSYGLTGLEDCKISASQAASATRSHHGSLPYLGPAQAFITPDQWADVRQQSYMLKHMTACNNRPSALLLPMGCKVESVPVTFGSNAGGYLLGLADPQPGRCRRTDGKKWRCGRAVVPDQKYCERHMHRGRGRSKAARLAKVNTPADGNQPLNSARPLNQPLIQLLNQLAVPVQPLHQPPEPVQKPPIPAQPLQWLPNPAQPFLQPHNHLPFVAQPFHAGPPSQEPNPSKPLDWSLNQTPMEAEPLNIVHAHGVPPNLAQAIPIKTVSEVKGTSVTSNGARISEKRVLADDQDDVLTLDVQGIKRVLENAPCSQRFKKLASQQKQLPNVADLLNVAHFRSPISQQKRPPSLVDVLKMVCPTSAPLSTSVAATIAMDMATIMTATSTSTSLIDYHLERTTKDNSTLSVNGNRGGRIDLPARREHTGAPLSLDWPDERAAEGKMRHCSSSIALLSGSLDLAGAQQEDPSVLTLAKVKHEKEEEKEGLEQRIEKGDIEWGCLTRADAVKTGGVSSSVVENHTQAESPHLVEERPECFGSSALSEKTSLITPENRVENSAELSSSTLSLDEAHRAMTVVTSPILVKESSNGHKHSVKLDINRFNPEAEGDHLISLKESQQRIQEPRDGGFKHHESSSVLRRGGSNLLDRTLQAPIKPEKSGACLSEKRSLQYESTANLPSSYLIFARKSTEFQENPVSLDMNSSVIADENLELHRGSDELEKHSTDLGSPTRVLQLNATFDRSPPDSNHNLNGASKSALILESGVLNSTEPLAS